MASLATFIVSTIAGGILGIVGVVATFSAVNPSAEHVAEQTTVNPASSVYGTR
jgi:hypothetical protein